jgi:hypothetical protein
MRSIASTDGVRIKPYESLAPAELIAGSGHKLLFSSHELPFHRVLRQSSRTDSTEFAFNGITATRIDPADEANPAQKLPVSVVRPLKRSIVRQRYGVV